VLVTVELIVFAAALSKAMPKRARVDPGQWAVSPDDIESELPVAALVSPDAVTPARRDARGRASPIKRERK
jgi:hypothetical protein